MENPQIFDYRRQLSLAKDKIKKAKQPNATYIQKQEGADAAERYSKLQKKIEDLRAGDAVIEKIISDPNSFINKAIDAGDCTVNDRRSHYCGLSKAAAELLSLQVVAGSNIKTLLMSLPETNKADVDFSETLKFIEDNDLWYKPVERNQVTEFKNLVKSHHVTLKQKREKRGAARKEIAEEILALNDKLSNASNDTYIITATKGARGASIPVIINKDVKLQLTLNSKELMQVYDSKDNSTTLVNTVERIFTDRYYGLIENRKKITSATTFCYKQDAVVAIDPSVLGEDVENAQKGGEIGAIATSNVVCHFIHADGKSDSENELYFNEIIDDGEKIRVYGQRKRDINVNYKNNQVFHAFFLISDGEYSASEYNFYGIYSVKDDGAVWDLPKGKELIIDAEPASDKYPAGRPERTYPVYIEYTREADENNGEVLSEKKYSNVEIAEMLDEAFAVIAEHGYDVAKNKPANFDKIVQARMIAERNGYRVKKIR